MYDFPSENMLQIMNQDEVPDVFARNLIGSQMDLSLNR